MGSSFCAQFIVKQCHISNTLKYVDFIVTLYSAHFIYMLQAPCHNLHPTPISCHISNHYCNIIVPSSKAVLIIYDPYIVFIAFLYYMSDYIIAVLIRLSLFPIHCHISSTTVTALWQIPLFCQHCCSLFVNTGRAKYNKGKVTLNEMPFLHE